MLDTDAINIQLIGCLEESIDKLQISGQIMPLTYEMKKNAKIVNIFCWKDKTLESSIRKK